MKNYIIVAIIIILIIVGVVWYKANNSVVPVTDESTVTTEPAPATDGTTAPLDGSDVTAPTATDTPAVQ